MNAIEILKTNGLYTDVIGIINDYTSADKEYWKGQMNKVFKELWMYRPLKFGQIFRYFEKTVYKELRDKVNDEDQEEDDILRECHRLVDRYYINSHEEEINTRADKYTQEKIDKMNRLYPDLPKCDMKLLRGNLWQPHMGDINDTELLIEYIDYIMDEIYDWIYAELECKQAWSW